jgi:REase_DpnII-MboI
LAQQRRDEAFSADRRFFRDNPDRSYRARLATAQEIEDLRSGGAVQWGWILTGGRSGDLLSLFLSILAAYFRDVRPEEWGPSVAGSSARCDFYLKGHKAMIELKYVRQPSDQNKIKTELARDILDYGKNPSVERLCVLVYDPKQQLPAAVQLEDDLSRPGNGLSEIVVKISPSRGAREPRL